jgi:hypothetical protein
MERIVGLVFNNYQRHELRRDGSVVSWWGSLWVRSAVRTDTCFKIRDVVCENPHLGEAELRSTCCRISVNDESREKISIGAYRTLSWPISSVVTGVCEMHLRTANEIFNSHWHRAPNGPKHSITIMDRLSKNY